MPEERIDDEDGLPEKQQRIKEQTERLERETANIDAKKEAWMATIEDMEAIAEAREDDGWDVLTLIAGDTGLMGRDTGDDNGEFGLSYIVGANDAEAFREVFEAGEFPVYDVYRQTQLGTVFIVTELRDPDTDQVVLIAGAYVQRDEQMCAYAAHQEDEMYTYVKKIDGTVLGVFHHDGYEKFFPEADRVPDPTGGWVDEQEVE